MASVQTPSPTDPDSTAGNFGGARMAGPAEDSESNVDSTSSAPGGKPSGQTDPQQALANAVAVIRQSEQSIVDISQQFPQASPEIRKAREAIRAILKKIVANPGGSEPPAPRTAM